MCDPLETKGSLESLRNPPIAAPAPGKSPRASIVQDGPPRSAWQLWISAVKLSPPQDSRILWPNCRDLPAKDTFVAHTPPLGTKPTRIPIRHWTSCKATLTRLLIRLPPLLAGTILTILPMDCALSDEAKPLLLPLCLCRCPICLK